jgi:hypothetical protein
MALGSASFGRGHFKQNLCLAWRIVLCPAGPEQCAGKKRARRICPARPDGEIFGLSV